MTQQNIVIFGATSKIAQEVAKIFAEKGNQLFLVGRDLDRLSMIANDLEVRSGKKVNYHTCDLTNFEKHPEIINTVVNHLGHIDTVLIADGTLSDQKKCETDFNYAHK